MKFKLALFVLLLLVTGCLPLVTQAQDTVLRRPDKGILDSLHSNILKERRLIEVFVPENYKTGSADKYDVLYVLDGGNWNTGLINYIQRYLESERSVPPFIVVSVLGIDRNKDLTPTKMDGWKTAGGGANFLSFLKDELIPHINKKYPSNGDNALWGHSLGGLFVINALLTEPAAFKSYIAVDPSLWWDNGYIQKLARGKLSGLTGLRTTLYISGRDGKDGESMKIASMDSVLQKMAPRDLTWKSVTYPGETHSSIRLKTVYDGLKFSYGWNSNRIEFHPMNGIVAKGKPIKVWNFGDTARVRYTLDGTVPTFFSEKIQPEIIVTGAAKLNVKQFTNRARYDKTKAGDFVSGEYLKPVSKPGNAKPGGFHYAYYEGEFDNAEMLKELKPQKTGITNADFDTENLPRKNNFALVVEGFLEANEDGYYIFVLNADKGSKLFIKDRSIIQWDGSASERAGSYILPLKKGFYPLRLEYFHKNEDFKLQLAYLIPSTIDGKDPKRIPLDLQYSRNRK